MSRRIAITPAWRMSLPSDIRQRHVLGRGGHVIIEDTGDVIVLRTVDQVVARAQALSREILAGRGSPSVDDLLDERRLGTER